MECRRVVFVLVLFFFFKKRKGYDERISDWSSGVCSSDLWKSGCIERMYITGGIGPSGHDEGFTTKFDLPNETAYAETCAAIGLIFWNHRMLQIDEIGRAS